MFLIVLRIIISSYIFNKLEFTLSNILAKGLFEKVTSDAL